MLIRSISLLIGRHLESDLEPQFNRVYIRSSCPSLERALYVQTLAFLSIILSIYDMREDDPRILRSFKAWRVQQ
jgi:hypothetical protein